MKAVSVKALLAKILQNEKRTVKDLSVKSYTKSTTVAANTYATVAIDVSADVQGYYWNILEATFASGHVAITNCWQSGTTVNIVCRNLTSGAITSNAQLQIIRWKV